MKIHGLVVCLLGIGMLCPRAAGAEGQKEIQGVVEAFLAHLGNGEWDKVATELAPRAVVVVARERDGQWTTSFQTGEEWLGAAKRNTNFPKFREPLSNVKVTIDGATLAYVRADFQVVLEGKVVSKGVDQFTLARDGGAWKLAAIAYTSTPVK
jgi:SnoaL-like protein